MEFAPFVVVTTRFNVSVPTPGMFTTAFAAVVARLKFMPFAVTIPENVAVLDAVVAFEVLVDCAWSVVAVAAPPATVEVATVEVLCAVTNPGVVFEMLSAESVTTPVVITPGRVMLATFTVCPGGSVARATGDNVTAPRALAVLANA